MKALQPSHLRLNPSSLHGQLSHFEQIFNVARPQVFPLVKLRTIRIEREILTKGLISGPQYTGVWEGAVVVDNSRVPAAFYQYYQ